MLQASREILEECIAVGGSVTGEHGIGVEKMEFMPKLFSPEDLAAMVALRNTFNPTGLCSPDKMIPGGGGCLERKSPDTKPRLDRPRSGDFTTWPNDPNSRDGGDFPPSSAPGQDPANPGLDPTRLTLYPPNELMDRAESQAARLGYETVQDYCAELLAQGIEDERIREQVAGVEARRGTLEGLHEIADDPEYLEELRSAASIARQQNRPIEADTTPELTIRLAGSEPPPDVDAPSHARRIILKHAGQEGDDPIGFLASLRRGDPVGQSEVAELAQALHTVESTLESSRTIDRRLAFALHRLALESQILHTDAWPGAFDAWMVDIIRALQETVDRILSGQDIRYT